MGAIYISQVAQSVPFDPTVQNVLTSTDVQSAIDELASGGGNTASPGFTWGRSGVSNGGTYLQNETVPSNVAGRTVIINNAKITDVSIANELSTTFTVEILEHDTTTYTSLGTFTVTAAKSARFSTTINITTGKQLAVKIADATANSAKNIVVNIVLRGTI